MIMEKVTYVKVNSANVRMDNSVDAEKVFDIACNVNASGEYINSYDSGEVREGDVTIATFSRYGESNFNLSFQTSDATKMCSIVTAVNAFIADVNEYVSENSLVNL